MQLDQRLDGRTARLELSGELTIYEAAALHDAVLGSLDAGDVIELDLSGVTELDTAGFQQLYLLQRELRATRRRLTIQAHSAATREVFDLLRADALFDDLG